MKKKPKGRSKKEPAPRSREERIHYNMSRIRSRDTRIEIMLRKALWHSGIRYRKNLKALPGTPDIAITKYRIAVFCDGEFWHGKNLDQQKERLKSNREFWISKIERNIERDQRTDLRLEQLGWYVLHFWETEIEKNLDDCVREIREAIIQSQVDSGGTAVLYGDGDTDGEAGYAAEQSPVYE